MMLFSKKNLSCEQRFRMRMALPFALFMVVLLTVLVLGMNHIRSDDPTALSGEGKSPETTIALVTYEYANSFYYREFASILQALCDEAGYTLKIMDGQGSCDVQISIVESLITMGIDAMIIDPVDAESLNDAIGKAMDTGIIAVVIGKKTANNDVFFDIDHFSSGYKLGAAAASWIRNNVPDSAKVALLVGSNLPNLKQRERGIRQAVHDIAPTAEIVYSAYAIDQMSGFNVAEVLLKATPDINVILCVNDDGALGALEAAYCYNVSPDTFFLGSVDGTRYSLEKVKSDPLFSSTVITITEEIVENVFISLQGLLQDNPVKISLPAATLVSKHNVDKYYS